LVGTFDPNKRYLEYYLARELSKSNNDVTVFSFKQRGEISEFMIDDFRVVYVPKLLQIDGFPIFRPREISKILKITKEYMPEVIHCQPLFSPLSLLFMNHKSLFDYKIVGSLITGVGHSYERLINSVIKKMELSFVKMLVKHYVTNRTKLFFAKNYMLKELLIQVFDIPSEKICTIPLGVDPEVFKFSQKAKDQKRAKLGLSIDDIVVVYSGKLIPSKKLDILIEAIAPLIRKNSKIKLLIIGKGEPSYIAYLKNLISHFKILRNVIFHHWVHKSSLPDLYSASDIAVWPGSPSISIIEAAAIGLPIIIKLSPIEIYAVEYKNGFVFEQGNIDKLREYLKILIDDKNLRHEMGNRSRVLVEQKLNWRSIATQYYSAYMEVLKS
jgi:glycosyltransferase involved in cell wall biosynthesis